MVTFPAPSSLCPLSSLPDGLGVHLLAALMAGWHWWQGGTGRTLLAWCLSTFHSLPLPPARLWSVCHPPQKPSVSPACGVGLALQPGAPKPAVTQRGTGQAKGPALTMDLGDSAPPCPPTVVPGRWEGAQPCQHILCLSPPVCTVCGKAGCNTGTGFVSSFR